MKTFFEHLEKMTQALRDPEYLFLVLEPFQFYGIALGVIGLIATYFMKNEKLQVASLVVIAVSAITVLPYLSARKTAENRIEQVYRIENPSRVKQFTANTKNRTEHQWLFLALAGMAGAALLVGPRRNRLGLGLAAGAVVFGLYTANYGLWMHYQDSLAYHPNLKTNEAPVREKMRARPVADPEPDRATPLERIPAPASPAETPARDVRPLTAGTGPVE